MSDERLGQVETLLSEFALSEVYFGSEGYRIFLPAELAKAQNGYARHPNGTSLTGEKPGDWKKEWLVFGRDTQLGDPYFVDTSAGDLPVYSAMHGMGKWEPLDVCPTLKGFLAALRHLHQAAGQSAAQIEPDGSTMTGRPQLKKLEDELAALSGERDFWKDMFERHTEWLEECEDCDG